MEAAAAHMRKAVYNLNEIIGGIRQKLHTPQKDLPTLNPNDLDESIRQTLEALQRLIHDHVEEEKQKDNRRDVIRFIRDTIKTICYCAAPFVKAAVSIVNQLSVVMAMKSEKLICRFPILTN